MKILEVETEHTGPLKILIEVLKEMLPEANIEFIMDPNSKLLKDQQPISYDEALSDEISGDENCDEDSENSENNSEDENISEENDEVKDKKNEKKDQKTKKDKSGLRITAIDLTKTVLINLKLDAKNFSKFKCKKKVMRLGVNLVYLHKLIKSIDKEDNITFYQEHDNKNLLNIKVNNPESGKETEFDLKLLELRKEKLTIPNVVCEALVTMNAQEFHKLCREMNQIAEYVDIRCLKNRIEFTCKGDYANRKTVYRTDDDEKGSNRVHIQHAGANDGKPFIVQGIYELRNLVMFAKCASLCNEIEIYLKSNYPLVIQYTVATLGRLLLCLSPVKEDLIRNANFDDEEEFYSEDEVTVLK